MTGPFQQHARELIVNGYQIVPIPMATKGPKLPHWQDLQLTTAALPAFITGTHTVTKEDRTYTAPNTRASDGVGILTKWTPAVDIDAYSEVMAEHMTQWCHDNLGAAPVRVGQAPKALLLYATSTPFAKVVSARWVDPAAPVSAKDGKPHKQRLEVLGEGQQFVALHTHPDTGLPYQWTVPGADPLTVPALDLDEITVEHARAAAREFDRFAAELGWEKVDGDADAARTDAPAGELLSTAMPPDESDEEVARVRAALTTISPDCSREEYLVVLAALKWTGWVAASEIALDWASASDDKFNQHDFDRDWRSLKTENARTATLGSLFKMAKDAGWDASRKPTEEQISEVVDELLAAAAELQPGDRAGRKALVSRIAAAGLDKLDEAEVVKTLAKAAKLSAKDVRMAVSEARKPLREHGEPTHANYARALLTELEDRSGSQAVGVEGRLWTYDKAERLWTSRLPGEYEVEVARSFDGLEGCNRRSDYLAVANHAYTIACTGQDDFFNDAPIGMACAGRFYTVADGEIKREELGAHHRQRVISEVAPKVIPTPLYDKLVAAAFAGDRDTSQLDLMEEYLGVCMLGVASRFEKVLMMKGVGRAGKGTLLKIFTALLPKSAVASVEPNKWSLEYYLADLAAKRLNVVGELSDEVAVDAAAFKRVIGRDQLTARHPTQRPFQFTCTAGHVFNANTFVFTKDHSEAFYTRWLMLEFRNSLIGRDDELDVNLAQKIIDHELPGVAARLLQAAKRVLERGHFNPTPAHHRLMDQWRKRSSTTMEFLHDEDACVIGKFPGRDLNRVVFYGAYTAWCRDAGRRPLGKLKFFDEIQSQPVFSLGIRFAKKSGNTHVVRGVLLRSMVFQSEIDDEL